jgi:alcohol dehydrogenase
MLPFDYQPRTRVVFGEGALSRLGNLAIDQGATRVLVVTDPGIAAVGHAASAERVLREAGLTVHTFDGVRENPDTQVVNACVEAAKKWEADLFVGLGGGSAMDTAKGANFLLTNGGVMKDYHGVGKASKPMLPLIAIPTTAGTGSECQSFALISDPATHLKMACGDPKAAARVAILDPLLTLSQPPRVTACTGVDALVHALETAVTRKRSAISLVFSREAFRLLFDALPAVLSDPADVSARGAMLLGAAYAGIAIENSMLGCAHSAANPLTARYGIIHGQAVGRLIPHVMRRNARESGVADEYNLLAALVGLSSYEVLISQIESVLGKAHLDSGFARFGMVASDIPALAGDAAAQWTAAFNPVAFSTGDFESVYAEVL